MSKENHDLTECSDHQFGSVSGCREEIIQQKAYLLWESSGKPEGDGVDFWLKVEASLEEEVVTASFGIRLLSEVLKVDSL